MKRIALIADGWKRWMLYAWAYGLLECIKDKGADVFIDHYNCFGNWNEDKDYNTGEYAVFNSIDLSLYDGVVTDLSNVKSIETFEAIMRPLRESGLPVINLNAAREGEVKSGNLYYVGTDNEGAMREMLDHMYDVHGCRNFVFLGGPVDHLDNVIRQNTFETFMKEKGLPVTDDIVLASDFDYQSGVNYMNKWVGDGHPLPDVFICSNDNIAVGVCTRAAELGYKVPGDFYVTGYDNLDKAVYFFPQISTASISREKIAYRAMELMLDIWKGEKIPRMSHIDTPCLFGESCGCKNNGTVDYREHIKGKILWGLVEDNNEDMVDILEGQLMQAREYIDIYRCAGEYFRSFEKSCDEFYILVDPKLESTAPKVKFGGNGYRIDRMKVAYALEDGQEVFYTGIGEWMKHAAGARSCTNTLYVPIHFSDKPVGLYVFKNPDFLYTNSKLSDMLAPISKAIQQMFLNKMLTNTLNELKHIYNRDQLTGVYNRIAFKELIVSKYRDALEDGFSGAVCFIDADNFKEINDTHGHDVGDKVLKCISSALVNSLSQEGYVCRYGGDEFIVYLPSVSPEEAEAYRDAVYSSLDKDKISVSIGLTLTGTDPALTLKEYVAMADEDMYRVKALHKGSSAS
ncbi:MAG: GGDEF domain-containing protein [Lachnospiraceae bacterium]|nr:GGDEF domain-containing protein [Lachnospiraceae bacterium]